MLEANRFLKDNEYQIMEESIERDPGYWEQDFMSQMNFSIDTQFGDYASKAEANQRHLKILELDMGCTWSNISDKFKGARDRWNRSF